jgi:hypothetical protein
MSFPIGKPPALPGDSQGLTFAAVGFKPLSRRERGWGEGTPYAEVAMVRTCAASPYPHPALRATFSRWEKGSSQSPSGGSCSYRAFEALTR